ncbi:MAG TPA: dipeptide ABC transporter ATP-binding protein [Ilumatobacteraceae bacterium]|nr:dipeptide ABC transporter ATP-binding protein [Ilumatobacteraceae bacterium]
MPESILELRGLTKHYPVRSGWRGGTLQAVDSIDLVVERGRSVGIVGESGCGKTTTARMMLLLERPTSGEILFEGNDIGAADARAKRRYRREVQPVFQNPYASLNPRMRVGAIVGEPLQALGHMRGREVDDRVHAALAQVGLPTDAAHRYPHQFSGGQRQRVALARALALRPRLVVLDEPVSALDVSIRAQMLNLLKDLEEELGLTYVLIAHDLPTLRFLVDEVVVMYLGRIVERGPTEQIFSDPRHPYTQALLSAVPALHGGDAARTEVPLAGEVPSPIDPPSGCHFRTRCPHVRDLCEQVVPTLGIVGKSVVACHMVHQPALEVQE